MTLMIYKIISQVKERKHIDFIELIGSIKIMKFIKVIQVIYHANINCNYQYNCWFESILF